MADKPTSKTARRFARTPASPDQPPAAEGSAATSEARSTAKVETKIGKVLALLGTDEGATIEELVTETGWQPHTARAALTGLRKKGHVVERAKRGDVTCYHIKAYA